MARLRSRRRWGFAFGGLIAGAALAAAIPLQAAAADLRQGNEITVRSGETVADDIYAAAGTITIDGTVNGNVIAAGGQITVSGTIDRDLMVAGGTVDVTGKINGSIRSAGGTITLKGPVGDDVVVTGGTVNIESNATIGRDLVFAGGTATIDGPIARNVTMGAGTVTVRSQVAGNVTGSVDHLRLEGARIAGNLDYTSDNQVELVSGATVGGTTTRHTPQDRGVGGTNNPLVSWIRGLIGIAALGLLLILLLPGLSTRASETLRTQPWASLGIGAAICIVTPIVALIVFIVGLLVGGWWLGVLLIPLYILALALGYVVSGFLLGRLVFDRLGWGRYHAALALLGGLVILGLVGLVPVIGGVVALAAVVFGLGAFAVAIATRAQPARPMAA
jgi:cytoskeletal protein CcmA (bactofilin family)